MRFSCAPPSVKDLIVAVNKLWQDASVYESPDNFVLILLLFRALQNAGNGPH
jgi:hypothetical protein